jgi:hypothetical protein
LVNYFWIYLVVLFARVSFILHKHLPLGKEQIPLLDDDLKSINYQYLPLAGECVRNSLLEVVYRFNLSAEQLTRFSTMTMDELKKIAKCGRARLTVLSPGKTGHF